MADPGFDAEWAALALGIKPAIRRTAKPDEADAAAAQLTARGAKVVRARTLARLGGRDVAVLYAARAVADAEALRDAEEPVLPGVSRSDSGAAQHREVGRRLGFPACCVDAFCARIERGVDTLPDGTRGLSEDYVALRDAWVARPDARVNNLLMTSRWQLVSHYPCRYDCVWSRRYADAVLVAYTQRDPRGASLLVELLARTVAVAPDGARAIVTLDAHSAITASDGLSARDAPFARTLVGARVAPDGHIVSDAPIPSWTARFQRGSTP